MNRIALIVLLAACHRSVPSHSAAASSSLVGATFPGISKNRLEVAGIVGKKAGRIRLNPGSKYTFFTRGCLERRPVLSQIMLADPFGPAETYSVVELAGLRIERIELPPIEAALMEGEGCVVVLGDDVLGNLVLIVPKGFASVSFRRTGETSSDGELVPIERDAEYGWPLVHARLTTDAKVSVTTLQLSVSEARTTIYQSVFVSQAAERTVDHVELMPGWEAPAVHIALEPGAPSHTVEGILGADVWNCFDTEIDLSKNKLVLHRPATGACAGVLQETPTGEKTVLPPAAQPEPADP